MIPIKTPKKLIEVALPLDAINVAAAREKSIRHGHPSTLHLWWARRPLAAARAVIFAQMVNDPGYQQGGGFKYGVNKEKAAIERERLFKIIEDLVQWENTNNEEVLARARAEIVRSWRETCELNKGHPQAAELFNPDKLPAFHDPFAGGGALPLEAQRLGLESYASDLNPVAVTINKAMIEIPPRFAGRKPVGPKLPGDKQSSLHEDLSGARGLAEDVRRYGAWMRAEAEKRIGHLYPKIEVTAAMVAERPDLTPLLGQKLTVIAWLWARTVKSPNPAFSHADVPLASTFVLSSKEGKEAYVEPVIEGDRYRFAVKLGTPPDSAKDGTKLSRGANFQCLLSATPIEPKHIYSEANAGRMGARLMAIVAEGVRGRVYLAPTDEHDALARKARPEWKPEVSMPENPRWFSPPLYGLKTYGDLFTPRQLVALTTFSDLVAEAIERCRQDALAAWGGNFPPPQPSPAGGGSEYSSPQRGEVGRGEHWQPPPVPAALLQAARTLRKNMTDAEQLLWQCLRGKQLDGFKFRKQHPIHRFVLDFYCPAEHLAIELDGGQHNTEQGKAADAERTQWLNEHGIRVLRFWNDEIFRNLDGVIGAIWDALHPRPNPPPLGEGVAPPLLLNESPLLPPAGGGWEGGNTAQEIDHDLSLEKLGAGAMAYAQAVGVYLGIAVDKMTDYSSSLVAWSPTRDQAKTTFGRQALPMIWDYAEINTFAGAAGDFEVSTAGITRSMGGLCAKRTGYVQQGDAQTQTISSAKVISTDPPYYDNIGYADLSDFFYVWLRKCLRPIFPKLYATLAVPKAEELVATPYRHGGKTEAEAFFLDGMTRSMRSLAEQAHPAFPVTIYYAFKQAETKGEAGTHSTGWETFLDAVLRAGFALTGTWPMRTERDARSIGIGTNALASSIVLVCRKRAADAPTVSRREFLRELNALLPEALLDMTRGGVNSPVAPVDLSQAIIGPGMAIFSQYAAVLEADGKPMTVRTALQLINRFFAEDDFDHDTQFCLHWFETQGWADGKYGEADVLARAKGTSVGGLQDAGVIESGAGKLRLLRWAELPADWSPETDTRTPVWEALHQLIRALNQQGESAAGALLARMPTRAEPMRALAYRLYTLCERKGWAEEARAYNELVTAWSGIEQAASDAGLVNSQVQLDI